MFLDKETYERAGLVGKPHGTKGGRGLRPRWSMLTSIIPLRLADTLNSYFL